MLEVIDRPEDVSPDWLTRALRRAGSLGEGKVSSLDFKIIGTGKMGDNARFTMEDDGDQVDAPDSMMMNAGNSIASRPCTD